jgi:DNA-binding ferritin-like protein
MSNLLTVSRTLRDAGVQHRLVAASTSQHQATGSPRGGIALAEFPPWRPEKKKRVNPSMSEQKIQEPEQAYNSALLGLLASSRDMTYHLQNAHWNVKSSSFAEHHKFFNDAYDMFWEMQDTLAEHIRSYDITLLIPNNPDALRTYSVVDIKSIEAAVPNRTGIENRFGIHLCYYAVFLDAFINLLGAANKWACTERVNDIAGQTLFGDLMRACKKQRWQVRSYEDE